MDIFKYLYHLKACPEDFLQYRNSSFTQTLVMDIYRKIYGNFNIPDSALPNTGEVISLRDETKIAMQIGCWFFSHPYFQNQIEQLPNIHGFLFEDLAGLSPFVNEREWIEDEDRAEEFIRLALSRCGIIPEGETEQEALDRLDALDTFKRLKVLKDSNAALERVKEIKRKMAEQKAREAANVYGRE